MPIGYKEFFEILEPIMGITRVDLNFGIPDVDYKPVYDVLVPINQVLDVDEINHKGKSENVKIAVISGCKTDEEILEFTKKITMGNIDAAKKLGQPILNDYLGVFWCYSASDYYWDTVTEYVTPEGELLYKRIHTEGMN